ncbi:MAG: hypothetical protein PUC01_05750 [Spirochaetales bacterium]|nr:hypothetical protein [Spirochaetales bacterium]
MVIFDPEKVNCEIFEIKHSTVAFPQQYRHLLDSQKCKDTEFRYGTIKGKYVIYRGESKIDGEVKYLNVEEYLKGLEQDIQIIFSRIITEVLLSTMEKDY